MLNYIWLTLIILEILITVINDVPVDFLANLDITGGNSDSSVISGKGGLIGKSTFNQFNR